MQTKKKLKYNQPIIEQNQTNQAIKCLRNAVVLNYYEKNIINKQKLQFYQLQQHTIWKYKQNNKHSHENRKCTFTHT